MLAKTNTGPGSRHASEAKRIPVVSDASKSPEISIALSRAQINHVVGTAAGANSFSLALQKGVDAQRRPPDHRLPRSLLGGLMMLASFPRDGSYLANTTVARRLGINPRTSHRYLGAVVDAGLLERHPSTRHYRLAP